MSIEAMKQALEALEYIDDGANNQGAHTGISWCCVSNKAQPAITSLRQAIAEAEPSRSDIKQEPVAWMFEYCNIAPNKYCWWEPMISTLKPDELSAKYKNVQPLYTHPQPKQEQSKCDNCGEFGECCQKQEPVAWQATQEKCRIDTVPAKGTLLPKRRPSDYEWVGLTDEERNHARQTITYSQLAMTAGEWTEAVQIETERRLKEKNT